MRNYKESNNKIVADEDLIRRTIIKIKEKGEIKVPVIVWVRKVAIGAAAMFILACSGAITYATLTKDARILQFFGIKLSENYEQQAVPVDSGEKTKEVEVSMKSFAIDSSVIVMEYEVQVDKKIDAPNPKLKIEEVSIFSPNIESRQKENISDFYQEISNYIPFQFETEQIIEPLEENKYRIFAILHIEGLKEGYESFTPYAELGLVDSKDAYASNNQDLLQYAYAGYEIYQDENNTTSSIPKIRIKISGIENEEHEMKLEHSTIEIEVKQNEDILKEKCNWKFYTEQVKPIESDYYGEEGYMWDVEGKFYITGQVIRGSFFNILNMEMWETEKGKMNFDTIEIKIKNQDGVEVKPQYTDKDSRELDDESREIKYTFVLDETLPGENYTIEVEKIGA